MTPFDLTDPAEGGLGKDDPLLLRFDEATPASDYTGTYSDGTTDTGFTEPTFLRETPPLDRTLSGSGRVFTAGSLYQFVPVDFADQAGTLGSVGIGAVIALDYEAQFASGGHAVIVLHGAPGAGITWGLRLELVDPVARTAIMRLFWESGGVEAVVSGAEFVVPATPFVVIASREVTDAGYVIRYAAAGESLGQTLVPASTPDPASIDVVFVGSDLTRHFHGVIDMVHVVHRPITLEECELVDYRLRQAGPEAYAARRSLMTGVKAWGTDLHLVVQRELQIEACVLALAKTNARRLARYVLRPDRSWGAALRYWEQLVQIPTRPGDGIDERRARVVTAMRGRLGCSETDLEALLAEALGYTADPTLADFTPGANEYSDNFDPLVLASNLWVSGHAQHAWLPYPNTHFAFTQPAGGNDYLQGDQAGNDDLRYAGWLGTGTGGAETGGPMYLRFIGSGAGRETNALGLGAVSGGKEVWARLEVRAGSTIPLQLLVGLVLGSIVDDEWIWVGVRNNAGVNDLVAVRYVGGNLDANFTTLEANIGALPRVVEIRHIGDGKNDLGKFTVRQAANVAGLAAALWNEVVGGPTRPDWGGPAAVSPSTQPNVTGPTVARWADWWHYAPHAGAKQHLRVFRDPADPGIYDVTLADAILQKNLLAHMGGTVIDSENGLTLENVASLLDRDPLEH